MPTGTRSPRCAPQRNSTVAGRLAAEARALWHMQNSTVQSQEALVVSPCWAGGSGATGTPLKRFLNLSHLPVPQAKLGESVQFLSRLAPHLKVLTRLFQPQKTFGAPWVPSAKKHPHLQGDGRARKNASQENRSLLEIPLLRAHPSFPALWQPDPIWSSALLPAAPGHPSRCSGP